MPAEKTQLVAVGLSHHTAPIEVREKLAMDESMVIDTLTRLRQDSPEYSVHAVAFANRYTRCRHIPIQERCDKTNQSQGY